MRVIVYEQPDGTVAVVNPAPQFRRDGESDDAFFSRVAERSVPQGVSYEIVDRAELPEYDSDTRARWRLQGGKPVMGPELPPAAKPPSELDVLRAEIAALRADLQRVGGRP